MGPAVGAFGGATAASALGAAALGAGALGTTIGITGGGSSLLGSDLLSSGLGAGLNFASARYFNAQAAGLSDRQMRFQADMANTAHQREVADLRAAGLNPILSATGGAGAASPGGASPSIGHADPVGSALAVAMQRRQRKLLATQDELAIAQKNRVFDEQALLKSQKNEADSRTAAAAATAIRETWDAFSARESARMRKYEADLQEAKREGDYHEAGMWNSAEGRVRRHAEYAKASSSLGKDIASGVAAAVGLTALGKGMKVLRAVPKAASRLRAERFSNFTRGMPKVFRSGRNGAEIYPVKPSRPIKGRALR